MAETVTQAIVESSHIDALPSSPRAWGESARIVYFVPQLTVGGTENQLAELVLRLDRSKFSPVVWSPGPWGPVGDLLERHGVPVFRFRLSPRRPIALLQSVRWLRKIRPAIFHSLGYGDHCLDVLAARLAGIPWRITSRRNMRHWDPALRLRFSERLRNRWSNLIVANSQAAAATCIKVERVPGSQIRVIYNGVDVPAHSRGGELRNHLGLKTADLIVGNVANLKRVKGQEVLLRAFREVVQANAAARLVICGEGEERQNLEHRRRELGLDSSVFLLGQRSDLRDIYPDLDLYVHSSYGEGLPTSVLEAMAHGLPVVATTAGGTAELFDHADAECLVPPGDPSALANVILRLLSDPAKRAHLGAANRKRVTASFSVTRMVGDYEELYLELLHAKGTRLADAVASTPPRPRFLRQEKSFLEKFE